MDQETKRLIEYEAKKDAAVFAQEFPGQTISGDWDSEAWNLTDIVIREAAGDEGWQLYSRVLHEEVARLVRQAVYNEAMARS
jgi:hypothetical protein